MRSSSLVAILVACASAAALAFGRPASSLPETGAHFLAPPAVMKRLTFGYDENLADGLWIRVIQDFDHCETGASLAQMPATFNPLDENQARPPSRCSQGWVFRMLDAASDLAPKFRVLYVAGGIMLSVAVDDREGARLIFEKGLAAFPNDWVLPFRAAYHYMFEVRDLRRAEDLLILTAKNGGPPWAAALAARLQTRRGQAILAKPVLEEALARSPKGISERRLRERLDEVNALLASGAGGESSAPLSKTPSSLRPNDAQNDAQKDSQ